MTKDKESPTDIIALTINRSCDLADKFIKPLLNEITDGGQPASQLAHAFVALRLATERWEATGKLLSDALAVLKTERIPAAFDAEKITTFTTQTGYRVTLSMTYRASIIAAQKGAAYAWLQANNLGDLITETVNASTLSAAGKVLLEDGKELPDDLFHAYFAPSASITKTSK